MDSLFAFAYSITILSCLSFISPFGEVNVALLSRRTWLKATSRVFTQSTVRIVDKLVLLPPPSIKSATHQRMMTVSNTVTLADFIRQRNEHPTNHFVLGNEAGDADSIVSSLTLAYIESIAALSSTQKTAIISIPKMKLKSQRPETMLLLRLAGLSRDDVDNLIFVDDPLVLSACQDSNTHITLVDHNRLDEDRFGNLWEVSAIVDHHDDLGFHPNATIRRIAYGNHQALVASTCTLVTERMLELWTPPYPVSISLLLLGTILLDSVNMSPQAGKGTPRDSDAIRALMDGTHWDELQEHTKGKLIMHTTDPSNNKPNCQTFFDALHAAKFDPIFWKELSVRDALSLDYKTFSYHSTGHIGISTVLESMQIFLQKPDPILSILMFMQEMSIDFLAIMWTSMDEQDHLRRQLGLCCRDKELFDTMMKFLSEEEYDSESLLLTERKGVVSEQNDSLDLHLAFLEQGNVNASRKQVAPIFLQFFQKQTK